MWKKLTEEYIESDGSLFQEHCKNVAQAIYEHNGNLYGSGNSLGEQSGAVRFYIKNDITLACHNAYHSSLDEVSEIAFNNVVKAVRDGDVKASCWWLDRFGNDVEGVCLS